MRLIGLGVVFALSLALASLAAEAQQAAVKVSRVGVLLNLYPSEAPQPQVLRQRLRDLRYRTHHARHHPRRICGSSGPRCVDRWAAHKAAGKTR